LGFIVNIQELQKQKMTMKFLSNYFILLLSLLATVSLTSCLEEEEGLYDKVGPVATISVFSAAKTAPAPGETINLTVRFYSPNVGVKELRLNETVAAGTKQQIDSRAISGFDANNSYVETFSYTVPAGTAGRRITLEVAAITDNDLSNARTLVLNIPQ
jgi:hypothetical protein